MPQDQNNLIWIDMEMTGLVPESDGIIEVAIVVTDANLHTVAEGPVLVDLFHASMPSSTESG